MAHVYVLRHGETECNRDGIIQGPRIDSQLSDTGHDQAARLASAFDMTDLDAIYASPMRRARETAEPLANLQDAPIQIVPELYEMDFGDLCGRRVDEAAPILADLDEAWQSGFVDRPLPGGESPLLAQHRIRGFVERLRQAAGEVAVVAHGRINRVLVASLVGTPLQTMGRYPQANASITHVEPPRVHRINDTTHLA